MTAVEETNDNCSKVAGAGGKKEERKENDTKRGWKAEVEGQRLQETREDKL